MAIYYAIITCSYSPPLRSLPFELYGMSLDIIVEQIDELRLVMLRWVFDTMMLEKSKKLGNRKGHGIEIDIEIFAFLYNLCRRWT